jgi:hypothetical protein
LDRCYKEPNRLAFYLNILATEFLRFDSLRQTVRSAEFFWGKRYELAYRMWNKLVRPIRYDTDADAQPVSPAMPGHAA